MKNQTKVLPRCPIRTTLELLGGKWRLLLINELKNEPLRFGVLKKRLADISEKMLIQELKTLADAGLVHRKSFGEVPPRVEYSLTESGKTCLPLIKQMAQFGEAYHSQLK